MRECLECGKVLVRTPKGHRERNYCSDVCRQRACRKRNKEKRRIQKLVEETYIQQIVHRESWQDELSSKDHMLDLTHSMLKSQDKEIVYMEGVIDELRKENELLRYLLNAQDVELVELRTLMEGWERNRSGHK